MRVLRIVHYCVDGGFIKQCGYLEADLDLEIPRYVNTLIIIVVYIYIITYNSIYCIYL